jgi:biotin-dependent carboxylase-like uncharacterized protein
VLPVLTVLRPGALTTVQDLGRPGYAHLGVPRSGALDQPAHRLANRLAGNPEWAAGLETTLDGCALRAEGGPVLAAVTGAPCTVRVDGRAAAWGAPVRVPDGAVLEIGRAEEGLRSYLAVGGGLAARRVLGSRSTDLLSGLGPERLTEGRRLELGTASPSPAGDLPPAPLPRPPRELVLPLRFGPRADWFTDEALAGLLRDRYAVSSESNRIGLRVDGPALERARPGELPSEGMVLGAVQVPTNGRPVLFLADHPTTGGYPVVGVVDEPAALARAAQAAPGTSVRFVRG